MYLYCYIALFQICLEYIEISINTFTGIPTAMYNSDHNLRHTLCDTNSQTYAVEKEHTYAFWEGGAGGGTVKEDQ